MAEIPVFPKWYFPAGGPTEPDYGGRCFESQEALDAAQGEGRWFETPQQAQAAAAATTEEGSAPPPRRSHH